MVATSCRSGTFLNVLGPLGRSAAASRGSAACWAPPIAMSPTRREPPSTTILSIGYTVGSTSDRETPTRPASFGAVGDHDGVGRGGADPHQVAEAGDGEVVALAGQA